MKGLRRWVAVALALAALSGGGRAVADDAVRAARARAATLELSFDRAAELLEGAPAHDGLVGLELGRLLLYRTDYEQAAEVLERPEVSRLPEASRLAALARDCARSMAGAVVVRDDEHGVVVRLQDDRDRVLVPLIAQVASKARASLARDLGVHLPIPTRIELVRDHFALSAMTGLPEQAARTTGTVAVANWGRVAMLTPRATRDGYPWMDTLAHEMTHLAIGRGSRDRAPLWFQEGVAKRQETRWRERDEADDWPPPDSIAAVGFDKGLGLDLDNLGPSIAMLPTPEHAMVAFAEVQSFVNFWVREAGDQALGRVLVQMRDSAGGDVSDAMLAVSGKDLSAWNTLWRKQLAQAPRQLPAELSIAGPPPPHHGKALRAMRLAGLLAKRNHHAAVIKVLEPVQPAMPQEQRIRAALGVAHAALGRHDEAWRQVQDTTPTLSVYAEAYALRGWLLERRAEHEAAAAMHLKAVGLDPWKTTVACEMLEPPALPAEQARASLCEAARRWP
jgi:hypothetical protein